jgi:hypothetical protein
MSKMSFDLGSCGTHYLLLRGSSAIFSEVVIRADEEVGF